VASVVSNLPTRISYFNKVVAVGCLLLSRDQKFMTAITSFLRVKSSEMIPRSMDKKSQAFDVMQELLRTQKWSETTKALAKHYVAIPFFPA
jgi:hypothetical protein